MTSFLFIIYTIMSIVGYIVGYISWYKKLVLEERRKARRAL